MEEENGGENKNPATFLSALGSTYSWENLVKYDVSSETVAARNSSESKVYRVQKKMNK